MNLAHFYNMIHFSGSKTSANKKRPTAITSASVTSVETTSPTITTTSTTTATTTTVTNGTTKVTTSSSLTKDLSKTTRTSATATTIITEPNQLTSTANVVATSAVGYSNGILYLPYDAAGNANTSNNNNNNTTSTNDIGVLVHNNNEDDDEYDEEDEGDDDSEADSLASFETLSDNVPVWVDGEKHWISGVDANTTCRDLISALLTYQHCQPLSENKTVAKNQNETAKSIDGNVINQSILNTKEHEDGDDDDEEEEENEVLKDVRGSQGNADAQTCQNSLGFDPSEQRRNDANYVIVRQHCQCEEFVDGDTKVLDLLPGAKDESGRRKYQLYLRRLAENSHTTHNIAGGAPAHVGSLLSTDKDSGMGSPVGSSRSARLRRRKHKSTINWLAQGNTLHPKLSQQGSAANERLMKIILAQDETIHRQLTLLREKERQISKIEEEKHRTRERELGKNYLLETYLKGLDEAGPGADMEEEEEIFIDEEHFLGPTDGPAIASVAKPAINKTSSSAKIIKKYQHQHLLDRKSKHHKSRTSKHMKTIGSPQDKSILNDAKTKTTITDTSIKPASIGDPSVGAATGAVDVVNCSQNDLEQQILWMEKLCSINKQLQKEEELLLKLHSKIRKHQTKRAYQSKQEVLKQITDLDNNIALQAGDIRRNEQDIVTFDEQLQKKLILIERLSRELDVVTDVVEKRHQQNGLEALTPTVATSSSSALISIAKSTGHKATDLFVAPPAAAAAATVAAASDSQQLVMKPTTVINAVRNDVEMLQFVENREPTISASATTPAMPTTSGASEQSRISKFTLHAMQSPQDLLSLQQLIAKPPAMAPTSVSNMTIPFAAAETTIAQLPTNGIIATNCQNHNRVSSPTQINRAAITNGSQLQLQQFQQLQQQQQQQQQQHINDKLHALHLKSVKKQMFSPTAIVGNVHVNAPILPSPLSSPSQPAVPASAVSKPPLPSPPPPPPPLPAPTQPQQQLVFLADAFDFSQVGTLV